ncbi:MAG: hypothetical protein D3922_14925, partial [Candidatus Electrothrix sp. AR1]|nr:hypothetical protein [Candidatus Electrothrix sp. AR1]
MGESYSGKWYKSHTIIAAVLGAVITGIFAVIVAFISNKNISVQPPALTPVPAEPAVTVPADDPLQIPPDALESNVTKTGG